MISYLLLITELKIKTVAYIYIYIYISIIYIYIYMYVYVYIYSKKEKIKILKWKYFGHCLYQFTIFLCTNFALKVMQDSIPIEQGSRSF